ncbi:MAG: RES family NAD+ phosphorylase [Armatimonadota bacterium]
MRASLHRLGLELLLAKDLHAARLWSDLVITLCYRTVVAGRDPLHPDAGRGNFGRWHNPRVTGAWYFADDLQTSLAEFAHHQEDGTYQVEILEADIGFPSVLVIDRGRWPSTPLSPPVQEFIRTVVQEHQRAYFRGALFGEAAFSLGASGLVVPSMRGPRSTVCVFTDASDRARIHRRRPDNRRGTLTVPLVLNSSTFTASSNHSLCSVRAFFLPCAVLEGLSLGDRRAHVSSVGLWTASGS